VRNPADIPKKERPKVEKKAVATIDAVTTMQAIDGRDSRGCSSRCCSAQGRDAAG